MEAYIERMIEEQMYLKDKIVKLEEFIAHNEEYKKLDTDDKIDMEDQLRAMYIYSDCLGRRISRRVKYF